MKTILLKAVVCVTLVFAGALNVDLKAQDQFITNDVKTGELVTSKIVYRQNGALYRHMKHDFKYDNQNRVVEKETFKWDSRKEDWMPYCKVEFSYTSDQVVMNYGKWSKKDKAYTESQERTVYALDGFNVPVAYQNYKWNGQNGNWKIVNDIKLNSANVLLASMR